MNEGEPTAVEIGLGRLGALARERVAPGRVVEAAERMLAAMQAGVAAWRRRMGGFDGWGSG